MNLRCNTLAHALRRFAKGDSGAVAVDWITLTAAVCGMVLAVFTVLTDASVEDAAQVVSERVTAAPEIGSF